MSTVTATLSANIIDLSSRIGKMEGRAEAARFLPSPVAPRIDAGEIRLNDFLDAGQTIPSMRVDLDGMYRHFLVIGADCSSIQNEDIRAIFENQIKSLHEKRALLEAGLRSFDRLLTAHSSLIAATDQIENEAESIETYASGKLDIETAPVIRERLTQLLGRVNFISPLFKGDGDEYCQTHFERKKELIRDIYALRMTLNLKETSRRREIKNTVAQILGDLTALQGTNLDWQTKLAVKKKVSAAFSLLPEGLRKEVSLANDPAATKRFLEEALKKFPSYLPEGVKPTATTLEELKEGIQKILSEGSMETAEREKLAQGALESAEENGLALDKPNGVYYFVWLLAHEKDPSAGGDNFGKVQAPKDLGRLLLAIDRANEKPLNSLQELRERVTKLHRASIPAEQRENLCAALLASAEKNGVKLDEANGVYYWVWFYAHQKDPRTGGANFGKIHAPKNLGILLQAIETVIKPSL